MARLILTQTDTAPLCGQVVGCAPGSVNPDFLTSQIQDGGAPGVTGQVINLAAGQSLIAAMFLGTGFIEPSAVFWDAGDWVIRFNVSVGDINFRWNEIYVCRFSIGCINQATVGSLIGQNIQMAAGVQSLTVSGAELTGSVQDLIYIVGRVSNASAHSAAQITIIPDQNVDTPIFKEMNALSQGNFPDRNYYCGPFQS